MKGYPELMRIDAPKEEPDKIAFEGVVQYLEHLGIGLDDLAFVAIFDLVEAPAMGEMTREGFVTGWTNASTLSNPCDTIDRQKEHAKILSDRMSNDPAYFRQIYKKCFQYAKPEGQRAVPVEESFAFWDMFYGGGKNGISWNTSKVNWYDLWKEYYTSKNNRPVNKDLWNQMAELVSKTREPNGESLAWWTEDGAWPTAIDEYVAFVKERHSPAESSSSS